MPDDAKTGREARDELFAEPMKPPIEFDFGSKTAAVFDDMLQRSVPFYGEFQRLCCELAADFARPGTKLYDLGCSTGTTLRMLHERLDPGVSFVGVDASDAMLDKAREKLRDVADGRQLSLVRADLNEPLEIPECSVVTMLLTLQFVRPENRGRLLSDIHQSLSEGGCLLLIEKVVSPHEELNRLFIEHYHELKRRKGYSLLEIAQKREALENFLIPRRHEENVGVLREAGFRHVDTFFKWYNFCGVIAVKQD